MFEDGWWGGVGHTTLHIPEVFSQNNKNQPYFATKYVTAKTIIPKIIVMIANKIDCFFNFSSSSVMGRISSLCCFSNPEPMATPIATPMATAIAMFPVATPIPAPMAIPIKLKLNISTS